MDVALEVMLAVDLHTSLASCSAIGMSRSIFSLERLICIHMEKGKAEVLQGSLPADVQPHAAGPFLYSLERSGQICR